MRTGANGDILMGTPLLAALRHSYPEAHLTWLAESHHTGAIEANPFVDEIISWDGPYWRKMLRKHLYPLWLWKALQFRRELRQRRYDIFISFQPEEWPLLLHGVAAPTTIGIFDTFRRFHQATKDSPLTSRYTHAFTHKELPAHRTDQYLLALKALGLPQPSEKPMSLGYTEADRDAAKAFLCEHGLDSERRFILVAPQTTWPTRNWATERYAEVADALARQGWGVVVAGNSPGYRTRRKRGPQHDWEFQDVVRDVSEQMTTPHAVAVDRLTFRQLAALIDLSAMVISGDTGPMHVAAALGTPHVSIFGPTSPEWYAPLAGRGVALAHPVPCGPCDQKRCSVAGSGYMACMTGISVPCVLASAEQLLNVPAGPQQLQEGQV